MVLSIALRPGTDWTSWITYATAGIMQGSLLVMCLIWKTRQTRLGIDDFGNSLGSDVSIATVTGEGNASGEDVSSQNINVTNERTPLLG